ncbi:hypothetical protein [Microbacterium hydrocarbonoxydans]|uniref:hypothetical protein n=1 Tax=Microbacterium hydrocarbonoxydans TaxID=273678 RepID=UPI003D9982E0
MTTHAPLSKITDLDLMTRLDADPGKTRYVREVERRIATVIETATNTLPDPDAAFNEALFILTSPAVVAYYVRRFGYTPGATLAKLAWGIARRNKVREAGLAGRAQRRRDPLYGNRSRSIEAMAEDGYDLAGLTLDHRTLDEVEEDRRARQRAIRDAFTQTIAGVNEVTDDEVKTVLLYTNLYVDGAPDEMSTHDAVAKTLRVERSVVSHRIAALRKKVAKYPVLCIAIREFCGDEAGVTESVELMMAEA